MSDEDVKRAVDRFYREPASDDPPAKPEALRAIWEAAGIDLEDLKRAHRAMKVRRGETA